MVSILAAFSGCFKNSRQQACHTAGLSLFSAVSHLWHTLLLPSAPLLLLTAWGFIPLTINDTFIYLFHSANIFRAHQLHVKHHSSILLFSSDYACASPYTWIPDLTPAYDLINQSINPRIKFLKEYLLCPSISWLWWTNLVPCLLITAFVPSFRVTVKGI